MYNTEDIFKAIEYMEAHLKDSLTIGEVADYVGFSKYHFTRLFKESTGFTPSDYYRGRKVTEALNYMKANRCKIIDAAFEYGFNSPEVFTRSCLSALGSSPSQIKKSLQNESFTGISPLSLNQLTFYTQFDHTNVREEELPAIIIKGRYYTSCEMFPPLDYKSDIVRKLSKESDTLFQLHWATDSNTYNHLIGIPVDLAHLSDDDFDNYVYKKIPNQTYLVFPLSDSRKELPLMKDYIYDFHLPRNKYLNDVTYAAETSRMNSEQSINASLLYIPVRRKNDNRKHY